MHELSMVMRLAGTAETTAEENNIENVERINVAVGEMSTAIGEYIDKYFMQIRDQYPHLKKATLSLEDEKAAGRCKECGKEFLLTENNGVCPMCKAKDFNIIRGRSLTVQSIEGE